ncbi:AarF/ABC1/UbiB kinase family protein [Skermania sp. ID1734]|uniref:ABC1 kinase family protein n=1 Tax=Skermania sp. ID1734 TaxID=2597516 RepID=UPI0011804DE1|nr:AarF/ABC1/UbiB kinase family protein [Skermania sp. ID1734]TSD99519.1 AarF/ABC1/UbiB kinase family protein [Skermania sp. ID1734]
MTESTGSASKGVPTSRLSRGSKLGVAVAGQMLRSQRARMAMRLRSEEAREKLSQESAVRNAESLVRVLGGMKGVAMKLGQMLSVLDLELVPPEHRDVFRYRLAQLRDSAPSVSFAGMRAVIEEDLGAPLDKLFAEFDEKAIGSASIGQVYRARLTDGRQVAVKVQYPGIDAAVRADLRNIAMFQKLLQSFLPAITPALLDELRSNLESELDYHAEAENQRQVAELFRDHPFIVIPDSIPELCSRRVLVTEYFEGAGFDTIRTLPDAERNRIGEIIFRFYVASLFDYHEFCGDPHPGNILLGADGRVCFIDFGLFNRMHADHVRFEIDCLRAAAEERGEDLYQLMLGRGVINPDVAVTTEECLDYVYAASQWSLVDEELRITPELATGAFLLAIDPRASEFRGMKHQNLPPEHLFSRRAEFLTFGVLGQIEATGNWHRIAREWIFDEPPATELGRLNEQWQRDHHIVRKR